MSRARVWVAISGGVDSAVAAAIARDAGDEVVGVTLDLGLGRDVIEAASGVAAHLGIEHHVVDARPEFLEGVVDPFVAAYAAGTTPNPCVSCNRDIKFGLLVRLAREAGAQRLVTGHYARVVPTDEGLRLARAADPGKDQSYFLFRVCPGTLAYVDFPLGGLRKSDVRARAETLGIPGAGRAESQDVCFLGNTRAGEFVCRHAPGADVPGPVVDVHGRVIGMHRGIGHYTVGQRKGLPGGEGPLFVIDVDARTNTVVAGPRASSETRSIVATDVVWTGTGRDEVSVCVRAGSAPVAATVVRSGPCLELALEQPVCAAPGQAAVCYDGDVIVGGGTIVRERAG